MVGARFLFGQWMVKFVSLICIVGGIGWSVVNCVVGGQVLAAVADGKVPLAAGIIVVSGVSLIVAVFGIKVLLRFQTVTAVPVTIAGILFYIVVCKQSNFLHETNSLVSQLGYSSLTTRGNWLSFFTIGYSVTATWGSGASDYYILFPEDTSSYQVFLITYLGIALPTTFVAVSGTLCGAIAYSYEPWTDAYNEYGIGGLINIAFTPWGNFGKFIVVVLYISLICNNIMHTYSCAFEFQLIDTKLAIIPRWCWAVCITIIYFVLSMAGREHLSEIISNFLPMLGYWISIYIVILLEENLLFRSTLKLRKVHYKEFANMTDCSSLDWLYNWEGWDKPSNISYGIAATVAFACGVAGAVVGMNQIYWQGPIARMLGDFGGDIGMWLCGSFSGIVYPVLRYFELKYIGK
jgi:NCS1 nucleoside transporter family